MKTFLRMILIFGFFFFASIDAVASFSDEFNSGTLDSRWTVVSPNPDSSVSLTGTALSISASYQNGGASYYSGTNYNGPRVLQAVSGDWTIEVQMTFDPTNDYQGAGILLCPDGEAVGSINCWRMAEKAYYPGAGGKVIRSVGGYVAYAASLAYLKIQKFGMTYTGWYSSDGTNWILNGTYTDTVDRAISYAGLLVTKDNWDGAPIYSVADFDYFRVTETPCTPPPSGIVSWWGGDNNALDMVGTNNGTVTGATYVTGMVGQAFSFDGASYVALPKVSTWDFGTSSFSIDAWFKSGTAGYRNIIRYTNMSGSGAWGIRFNPAGQVQFLISSTEGVEYSVITTNSYNDNNWHFVAGVRDAVNGKLKIYIDGNPAALDVSEPGVNIIGPADAYPAIGRLGSYAGEYFNGLIDEVTIYSRVLSAGEIAAIYNAGSAGKCRACTAPPTDMVSWWGGDNNALDMVGANDGMLIGGATFAPGKVGQAFSFDGLGDYIDAGTDDAFNFNNGTGDFTIDAWINPASFPEAVSGIVAKATEGPFSGWAFYVYSDGRLGFGGVGFWEVTSAPGVIPAGSWAHVSVTKSGDMYTLYKNGGAIASLSHGGALETSTTSLRIGTDYSGSFRFHGLIDEVEIFNRALSADEIGAIYNAGSAGKCAIDRTPVDFSFTPVSGVQPGSTQQISFTVSGINFITPISITGGEYAIGGCGGTFTSALGTVNDGDIVCVQITSSTTAGGTASADLTIGTVTSTFTATTLQYYARVTPGPKNYSASLAAAYAGATLPGDIIEAYEHPFDEQLDCNGDHAVTLNGGYNPAFDQQTGWATVKQLTISGTGGLTVSGIVVQ